MNIYTIYCTKEQTKKALELGAPIEILPNYTEYRVFPLVKCKDGNERPCIIPTAEQMIGFLRGKGIKFHFDDGTSYWRVNNNSKLISYGWSEQKELAAIDAALEYLEKQKEID